MHKFISYCVFAHFSLILVFANLMETAKDSWRAIRPSTALHSGLKPSCCSQNIWGPPWHFEKPMMQPGHQLISEDSALVPMASLSHTDVLTTHQSSNPSICTYDTSKFQPIWWKPENTCLQVLLIQSSGALYILYILIFQGQPETTGLRPALMKGTISCWWWALQRKPHPASWATCCSIS